MEIVNIMQLVNWCFVTIFKPKYIFVMKKVNSFKQVTVEENNNLTITF